MCCSDKFTVVAGLAKAQASPMGPLRRLALCVLLTLPLFSSRVDAHTPPSVFTGAGSVGRDSTLFARVKIFVSRLYIHGVPYQEAHALGPQALPILDRLLRYENYKPYWANTVTAIGFIGAPKGFPILRRFLLDRFAGEVDGETFNALLITPSILGTIQTNEVVEFLEPRVNPDAWRDIRWNFGSMRRDVIRRELSECAIHGLSYTGTPRAKRALLALKERPYYQSQLGSIDQGLEAVDGIAAKGLDGWVKNGKPSSE
jgi:hypothetical protein